MRPTRLELEGFGSFRERCEIDFSDAELFVLTGPTGAGKSTIIDALTFALYGCVARYDDRRLVAPVISQGMAEARVRLDFRVNGCAYTAVRVVRRTKAGATTKEARLEDATGRALAGNADELTARVTELVGLPFEHFTKCVVLPQGDFADFLHASPGDRQELLVELLGIDIYKRIAFAAGQRRAAASRDVDLLTSQLDGPLAAATPAALSAARERVGVLESLVERVAAARSEIEGHRDAGRVALEAVAVAERQLRVLEEVDSAHHGDAGAAEQARSIAAAHAEAIRAMEGAVAEVLRAQAECDAVRPEAELRAVIQRRDDCSRQREALAKAEAEHVAASERARARAAELAQAEALLAEAISRWDALKRDHAAHDLAGHLIAGDACPVCLQTVASLPAHPSPEGLDDAKAVGKQARELVDRARVAAAKEGAAAAAAEERVRGLRRRVQELGDALADAPSREEAGRQLERAVAAAAALAKAKGAEQQAREAERKAKAAAAALEAEQKAAWAAFDRARDRVAELGPPEADRSDLASAWSGLSSWAVERAQAVKGEAAAARERAERAAAEEHRLLESLAAECAAQGVEVGTHSPWEAAVHARASAVARADQLAAHVEAAKEARRQLKAAKRAADVAGALHTHLGARRFEAWLLGRALRHLVAGATMRLRELSSGAYSLALDEGSNAFQVIDHRNADERRPARTLSGGETFLASLSLALALSEHVADLAAGGAARLDALFLDEGFGTLDAETLDVVAAAIEELQARGRMVGLVTHVPALAERVPVRFEVRKVGVGSAVERAAAAVA